MSFLNSWLSPSPHHLKQIEEEDVNFLLLNKRGGVERLHRKGKLSRFHHGSPPPPPLPILTATPQASPTQTAVYESVYAARVRSYPQLALYFMWSWNPSRGLYFLKEWVGGIWYSDPAHLRYQFYCTSAASCKKKKKHSKENLFVFLISKGMSYLLLKCINEDLTLHQMECFLFFSLTNICMYV